MLVDAHCDALGRLRAQGVGLDERGGQVDLLRLERLSPCIETFAVYVGPEFLPDGALRETLELIARFRAEVRRLAGRLRPVLWARDVDDVRGVGALLSVEGAEALGQSTALVDLLFDLGVRMLSLTWNRRNLLADGAWESPGGPLSRAGHAVLVRLEELGILADVSHLSPGSFWSLARSATRPLCASHSNARALCEHPRNLTDDQLRAVADSGGVVGLNFYPAFLTTAPAATEADLVAHALHLAEVMGAEHVGLGTDFDGIPTTPAGYPGVEALPDFGVALAGAGFSRSEVDGIMGGNWARLLRQSLPAEEDDRCE